MTASFILVIHLVSAAQLTLADPPPIPDVQGTLPHQHVVHGDILRCSAVLRVSGGQIGEAVPQGDTCGVVTVIAFDPAGGTGDRE